MKAKQSILKQPKVRIALIAAAIFALGVGAYLAFGSNNSDVARLANATPRVQLNDGDSYDMSLEKVTKTIDGKKVEMLSYNGSIPGPSFVVYEGSSIKLNITNNLDIASTIHPHGINNDVKNDGVPDISQPEIKPGESYTQNIRFTDPGVYWYHPHVRADYTQAAGMYANFLVKPTNDTTWDKYDNEQLIMLSDLELNDKGELDYNKDEVTHVVMGRFGSMQLVNGEVNPTISVRANEVTRFYFTNSASARSFRLTLPEASIKLVGGDNGLYEQEEIVDHVTVAPSERYFVDVLFEQGGDYPMYNDNDAAKTQIATIQVTENDNKTEHAKAFQVLAKNTEVSDEIAQLLSEEKASGIQKRLATRVNMHGMFMQSMAGEMASMQARESGEEHGVEWEDEMPDANSRSTIDNTQWSLVDLDRPRDDSFEWTFNQGDVVRITIENSDNIMHPMQHPIHLHGQKFIVDKINGESTTNRVFKDVVQIPRGDTYEIVVKMENKGTWLLHCHISEHMESGMMGRVIVN